MSIWPYIVFWWAYGCKFSLFSFSVFAAVQIQFSSAVFSFGEADSSGFVEIVADMAPSAVFQFNVNGGECLNKNCY